MHGTMRAEARFSDWSEARPAPAEPRRHRWITAAALLTGSTLLSVGWERQPDRPALPQRQVAAQVAARPSPPLAPVRPAPPVAFVPVVRIALPDPLPPAMPEPAALPPVATAPSLAALPAPEWPLPGSPEPPQAAAMPALRPVDIEQIAGSDTRSPQIAQLDGPEDRRFAEKAQVAQLSVPLAVERELALLQEEAPAEVAVRFGDRAIGMVAIRVSQINTVDVQLAGLLEVMADRFAPEEFARLRDSAAAGTYVPLDELRAAGLGLRYDPVYDELVVGA